MGVSEGEQISGAGFEGEKPLCGIRQLPALRGPGEYGQFRGPHPGQQAASVLICREGAKVKRMVPFSWKDAQISPENHSAEPCEGVSFGFGPLKDAFQRRFAPGLPEPVAQTLMPLVERGKIGPVHGPQSGKDGTFAGILENGCASGGFFSPESVSHSGGHPIQRLFSPALPEQKTYSGSGRETGPAVEAVMPASAPWEGQRPHGGPQPPEALAVFDAEDIIGRFQQSGVRGKFCGGSLTCGGEAVPNPKFFPQKFGKTVVQQSGGKSVKGFGVPAFRAEGKPVHDAGSSEGIDGAEGKFLRGSNGPGQRQFEYEVGAASDGSSSPGAFANDGEIPPLNKIAAHDTDDAAVLSKPASDFLEQKDVSAMQGIIFRYDTGCGQKFHPQMVTIDNIFVKTACRLRKFCYNKDENP